ncbi:MAG: NAD(P)-binding domain-containing protein [Micrococcaceae bacterium]
MNTDKTNEVPDTTVIVIGAGQAGLSAGYQLRRRGFVNAITNPHADHTFIIFDANPAPGGAWQHRWESLRMETVNGIFDLPDFPKPSINLAEPARIAIPNYFTDFEKHFELPILRPVTVFSVSNDKNQTEDFIIKTSKGIWHTKAIINATGTWNNPVLPSYPGQETFQGKQLHTKDYLTNEEFRDKKVAVVGGGISALQQLEEISQVGAVYWYTRNEPIFHDGDFRPETEGREVIRKVTEDVEAGKPSRSIVSYTGLPWTPYALAAKERGVLNRRPMFTVIEPKGVREVDGNFTELDTILWATGFRADLKHLAPLQLQNSEGGILVKDTQVLADPRIYLIGFGPSQSTVGANRAGTAAVRSLIRYFKQNNN